jgi:hypothetical protein
VGYNVQIATDTTHHFVVAHVVHRDGGRLVLGLPDDAVKQRHLPAVRVPKLNLLAGQNLGIEIDPAEI